MGDQIFDSWIIYRIVVGMSTLLPRKVVLFFGDAFAGGAFFAFFRKNRRILIRNYSLVFRNLSKNDLKWLAFKNFRNFSKFIYEFILIPTMNLEKIQRIFVFEGIERIEEVLKKGKGAILLTAHIGNWELGGVAFSIIKGLPITVIAWPHRSRRVTD